jgi:hypothetical protein
MRHIDTIKVEDISKQVEIPSRYIQVIRHLAKGFSIASLTSPVSSQDLIKATLRAHASLNERKEVCMDDLRFILMIQPYLVNPFSPHQGQIVEYRLQGFSIREIGRKIGKSNYNQQIQRVINKAKLRGIIDFQPPQHVQEPNQHKLTEISESNPTKDGRNEA